MPRRKINEEEQNLAISSNHSNSFLLFNIIVLILWIMIRLAPCIVFFLSRCEAFSPSINKLHFGTREKATRSLQYPARIQNSPTIYFASKDGIDSDEMKHKKSTDPKFISSRRRWFTQTATSTGTLASILSSNPNNAFADAVTSPTLDSTVLKQASLSTTNSLCDPTVSIMERGSRKLYLLGTAHISAESAQLAGLLVRQVRPNAVFVELDAKRIGRISPSKEDNSNNKTNDSASIASSSTSESSTNSGDTNSNMQDSPMSSPQVEKSIRSSAPVKTNPFNLKARIMQAGQALVGDSIKKLYQKLESQGFSAGEEVSKQSVDMAALYFLTRTISFPRVFTFE